jgi:NAD(P)-dependent dehydrogenase (short-subunit alcohol dehydrogenase family)
MIEQQPPTSGKAALVTGATSGIGRAAISLARCGYRIIVVGRDADRGVEVVEELDRVGAGGEFLSFDLLDLGDIRRLAREVTERYRHLDMLLNSAGGTFRAKALTPDGIKRTFAFNTIAPYAITTALLSPLKASEGRVVNVITQVPVRTRLNVDELIDPPSYNPFAAYNRAKLALIALTLEQAARYADAGITPVAVHPGIVFGTRFGNDMPA